MFTFHKLALAAGLVTASIAASAGTLALTPPSNTGLNVGDSLNLQVVGQGFAENIVGGGFNLGFDASMLRLNSVTIDPIWNFVPDGGAIDNVLGTLTDASFNAFPATYAGNFNIAMLAFTVVGAGASTVVTSPSALFVWSDDKANLVAADYLGAKVATAVPEPGTYGLMALGLGLLAFARRRKG